MTEKDAYVEGLALMRESLAEVGIASITTDANVQIRNYMSDPKHKQTDIKHGLDVWHVNKNLQKNLQKKATKKVCGKI